MQGEEQTGTVAWLLNGIEGYGVASVMFALSEQLQQRGWRTPLICMSDGQLAHEARERGYKVVVLGVGVAPGISGNAIKRLRGMLGIRAFERKATCALVDALLEIKPDVLEMQKSNLLGVGGAAARKTGVIPIWDTGRCLSTDVPFGLNWRYYQRICAKFDITIIATSKYLASTLGNHPIKPIVVHNGVDTKRFDPSRVDCITREEIGIPNDAIVFGIVGSLSTVKGQDCFLKAMAQRMTHDPPLHLLLLGAPTTKSFAQEFRKLITATNFGDRLHMIGHVTAPERYYPVMDIAANTYIWAEGFGLSVVEAMMMGTPVLAHALGGPAETIIDRKTGWHIPEPTVEAMVAGIDQVLADRSRWPEMGTAARQHAIKQFTIERQAQQYLDVLTPRLNT